MFFLLLGTYFETCSKWNWVILPFDLAFEIPKCCSVQQALEESIPDLRLQFLILHGMCGPHRLCLGFVVQEPLINSVYASQNLGVHETIFNYYYRCHTLQFWTVHWQYAKAQFMSIVPTLSRYSIHSPFEESSYPMCFTVSLTTFW